MNKRNKNPNSNYDNKDIVDISDHDKEQHDSDTQENKNDLNQYDIGDEDSNDDDEDGNESNVDNNDDLDDDGVNQARLRAQKPILDNENGRQRINDSSNKQNERRPSHSLMTPEKAIMMKEMTATK